MRVLAFFLTLTLFSQATATPAPVNAPATPTDTIHAISQRQQAMSYWQYLQYWPWSEAARLNRIINLFKAAALVHSQGSAPDAEASRELRRARRLLAHFLVKLKHHALRAAFQRSKHPFLPAGLHQEILDKAIANYDINALAAKLQRINQAIPASCGGCSPKSQAIPTIELLMKRLRIASFDKPGVSVLEAEVDKQDP